MTRRFIEIGCEPGSKLCGHCTLVRGYGGLEGPRYECWHDGVTLELDADGPLRSSECVASEIGVEPLYRARPGPAPTHIAPPEACDDQSPLLSVEDSKAEIRRLEGGGGREVEANSAGVLEALDHAYEALRRLSREHSGHSGDEETGEHDQDCLQCEIDGAMAHIEAAREQHPRELESALEPPYVCPGCHAVGGERCAPGCIDAEIEAEREDEPRGYEPEEEDDQ